LLGKALDDVTFDQIVRARQADAALEVGGDLADVIAKRRSDSIRSVVITLPPRKRARRRRGRSVRR